MLDLKNVFEDTTNSHRNFEPLQTNLFYVDIFNDYGDGIYCKKSLEKEPYTDLKENTSYLPPLYLSTSDMDDTLLDNTGKNDLLDKFKDKHRLIKPCISANKTLLSEESKTIKLNIKMNSSLRPNIGNVGDGINTTLLQNKSLGQDSLYIIGEGAMATNTNGQLYIRKDIEVQPAYLEYEGNSARVLINRITFNEDGLTTSINEKTKFINIVREQLGTSCSISWKETIDFAINNFHKDWISLFYNRDTNSRFSYEVDAKDRKNANSKRIYNTNYRFASYDKDMIMFKHMQEMRALLFKRIIITLPKQKIILKGVFPNINKYSYDFNYNNLNGIKELVFNYNYRSYEIVDNEDSDI